MTTASTPAFKPAKVQLAANIQRTLDFAAQHDITPDCLVTAAAFLLATRTADGGYDMARHDKELKMLRRSLDKHARVVAPV
jgi:hypothetical protein